jgi:hypothetical protein
MTSSVLELDSDKRVLKRPAILEKSLALEVYWQRYPLDADFTDHY